MSINKINKLVEGLLKGDVEVSYPLTINPAANPLALVKTKKKKFRKKLKQVTEEMLNEGLADMYNKYYSNIDNGLFWKLVTLDPTYRGGDNAGNYARWILNLWVKNLLKKEDFYKVTEYLTDFEAEKKKFPNKDIFQFKSLPDLAIGLDSVKDQEVELSKKQKQRDIKKQGVQDADKVFENAEWQIWIPKTYEASCNLGTGTRWCTASTSDDYYYKDYSKQGPLYVIINNNDPSEKYQFHFQSQQFMDKNDKEVEIFEFLKEEHPDLLEFFEPIIEEAAQTDPKLFPLVKDPSEEMIAEGMDKLTGYSFKVEGGNVYQEVQLSELLTELDRDLADFIDIVYGDGAIQSVWNSLTSNEEISDYVKKFFDVNMKGQSLQSFLEIHPRMYADLTNLFHRYSIINPETVKKVEDIVGFKKDDLHGSYLKYLWINFDYHELMSEYGNYGSSMEGFAEYLSEDNLRYHYIYLDGEEEEKLEKIVEYFKAPFEESEEFFQDVMNVFKKHKDELTDRRNKQQKLKLGHESIKAIIKKLELMED